MSNLITPRYQTIELVIPTGTINGGQFTFNQVPQLQSFYDTRYFVYILAIDVFTNDSLTLSPFNSNNPVATSADLKNTTLSLVRQGDQAHSEVPLAQMSRITSGTSTTPFVRDPFRLPDEWQIDWTKTYLHLIAAPISAPPFSYIFGVHYSYYPTPESIKAGILPAPWNFSGVSRQR
jgi:hypothetical protein